MRMVEARKRIKSVYEKRYPVRITNFSFENVNSLGNGSLLFKGGISVVCGANGTGKSTILRAIHYGLRRSRDLDSRFGQPKITTTLEIEKEIFSIEFDYSQPEKSDIKDDRVSVDIIDPSKSALFLVDYFLSEKNLDEWKESVSPIEFSGKELATISQLVGKKYETLRIYELDDITDDKKGVREIPLPYFEVVVNGREYSTPTMGMGELVLLYTYWKLQSVDDNSIILLEEPDTYVSYSSQEELFNVLAKFSDEKNLWVILTTHSTAIASKVDTQHMTLLYNLSGEPFFVQNPPLHQVISLLGLPEKRDGLLLVEDDEAEEFLRALISVFDPSIFKRFAIINLGGTGKIISSLKRIPAELGLKVVGVFDGDMSSNPELHDLNYPYVFLPGQASPEHMFMHIANTWHLRFSEVISREHQDLMVILSGIEAQEHHNWIERLCERLEIDKSFVIHALIKVWTESTEQELARSFISQLQMLTTQ